VRESDKFVLAEVDTEALTDGAVIFVVRRDGACYREFAEYPAAQTAAEKVAKSW